MMVVVQAVLSCFHINYGSNKGDELLKSKLLANKK
jgi:hypothetical protein